MLKALENLLTSLENERHEMKRFLVFNFLKIRINEDGEN